MTADGQWLAVACTCRDWNSGQDRYSAGAAGVLWTLSSIRSGGLATSEWLSADLRVPCLWLPYFKCSFLGCLQHAVSIFVINLPSSTEQADQCSEYWNHLSDRGARFLPARRYASAGLCDSDVSVHPSVCLSVCHTPVLCVAERKQYRKCTPSDSPKTLVSGKVWLVEKFARGHPKKRCQMRVGWVFSTIFNQYVVISRKRCILDTKLLWGSYRNPYANYRMVSVSMTLSDPWPGFQGHGSFKRRVSPKRRILQTQLLYRT